jgi:2C-methyl-D-erythritol 2,4-cyclodiphosphate synthase
MTGISVDDITHAVEDAFYAAVGLGILGFQHLQVQRRELAKQVAGAVRQVTEQVERTIGDG